VCCRNKRYSFSKELIGKYPEADISEAFVTAAEKGNKKLLAYFIGLSGNPNTRQRIQRISIQKALRAVVANGSVGIFAHLKKIGALFQTDREFGNTLVITAARKGHSKMLSTLLRLNFGHESGKLDQAGMAALRSAIIEEDKKIVSVHRDPPGAR
jgi:hypothetical protein